MYNNGGGGNPTEEPDLLAALVNQADLGSEQLLDEEDFSGLVEMADIGLGEDILVSGDGGVQAYRVPQPVVGSTVEIETSQVPFEAMQLSAGGGEEHDEDHGHGQQQGQPPEQPEQQVNLTMASDVDMMETSIEEQPPQQEPGTLNQPVIESSPIVQQHSEPPGTLQPTIVTASLATESLAPTATVQSTTIKPTVLTYPRVSIASASTPPQLQVIGISSASSSVTSGHQQQQPVYVTTNQLSGGNISYILPHGTQLAGGNRTPTLAVKGVSSAAGNTLVINQPKTVSSSNLKLIQTSKGQQLILAAPYTPPSCSSSGGTSATSTTAAPIAQKSSTIAIKGPVITGSKSIPATVAQGVVASGTAGSGQQLIILSPVKQSPHHTSQAGGSAAKSTPTFALPTAMKMVHLPSGSTTKLQQIAPAPGPSSASSTSVPHLKTTTQRVIAPAPMKPHGVAISGSSVGNKPIQTYVHATGGQKNVQYISFVPSVPGAAHPIANQTQAKLIATSSGGLTKYVPLKPQGSVVAKQITTGTGGQTLKPNLVHLTAAGLAGGSGAQKMLINAPTSSIKIATSLAAMGATKLSATTVTSGAGSSGTGGKATSIWMLPKSTQMIKMEGGGGGGTLSTSGPHGSTALQLQATTKPGGSEMARERAGPSGLAASKYIPIAPNPTQIGAMKIEESKTTHLGGTHVMKLNLLPNPDPTEEARRKPCNCTRSQCLKLYCDCFANGEFCHNCNCVSCCNNLAHEETRQKAIRLCLDRNPNAFHPKIGQQAAHGDVERKHTKGCCCKRSGCLKNYCECYEAKILCSDKCKCVGCKNFEESTERKTLMYLADAAEVRSVQQSYTNKVQIWGPDLKLKLPVKVKSDCHPFNIFTDEILEATASCMLAQAEEGEFENYSEENIEGLILDQFGECLSQILNMATNGSGIEDGDLTDEFEEKPNTASLTTSISEVVKSGEAAAGAERA